MASPIIEFALAFGSILWSLVGIIAALVIIYGIYKIVWVASDYASYIRDHIAFGRGKIKKAAGLKGIELVYDPEKQLTKSEIDRILDESGSKPGPKPKESKKK